MLSIILAAQVSAATAGGHFGNVPAPQPHLPVAHGYPYGGGRGYGNVQKQHQNNNQVIEAPQSWPDFPAPDPQDKFYDTRTLAHPVNPGPKFIYNPMMNPYVCADGTCPHLNLHLPDPTCIAGCYDK